MTPATEKSESRMRWAAAGTCAVAGMVLCQFFGNATRGYVDTPSAVWWWVSQWLDPQAEAEHGWLILGLSAWLLGRNLRTDRSLLAGDASATNRLQAGSCLNETKPARLESAPYLAMLVALALHAVGFIAQQTRFSIVALLLFVWGVIRLAGGRRWGDAAKFPLVFLVFAIPVNVLDSAGFWLRLWVVDAAGVIARVTGLDVVRSGTQLFAPDGRYQYDVVAACSGVRSLMALLALSLLIGYLEFRSTRRRALMLLLCFPLTYAGNVARIAAIILAAQLGGQAWGERAHDVMGYGVFAIVLGGVLLAARMVQRWWPERRRTDDEGRMTNGAKGARRNSSFGIWNPAAAVAVVAMAVGEMVWLGNLATRPGEGAAGVRLSADGRDPAALPAFIGTEWIGRRAAVTAVEHEILPADTGFSRRNYVEVRSGAHAVFVSVVLSGRDRTAIHRPEVCLVGQGWTIRGRAEHVFTWPGDRAARVPATLLRTEQVDRATGRRIPAVVAYWFVNRDTVVATHGERFWRDAWNRLRGRRDRWAYVLVQADAGDGDAAALVRMQAVLDGTLPAFQAVR